MENKMENKMKKCKLFLALGEEQELQDGYEKIGAYIQRLNRTYRAKGLQLQLIPFLRTDIIIGFIESQTLSIALLDIYLGYVAAA